jgi:hypothetical protein
MSAIGTPSSVYFKSEEMSKLNVSESALSSFSSSNSNQQNDYFFNYITLGLVSLLSIINFPFFLTKIEILFFLKDILFSSETNKVIKFIFHSNFPCHYNFNR